MRHVTRHGEYTLFQYAADRFRVERGNQFCGAFESITYALAYMEGKLP